VNRLLREIGIGYASSMKYSAVFVSLTLLVITACAPSAVAPTDGFPLDRSKRWVLILNPSSETSFTYLIDFVAGAPTKDDSLYNVKAEATLTSKKEPNPGAKYNSRFSYNSAENLLIGSVPQAENWTLNCALVVNENQLPKYQRTDWVGVGLLGPTTSFIQAIQSKSKNLEQCVMIDARQFAAK
jgi:hypothetical protein